VIGAALSLPIAAFFGLTGGFLFGRWLGALFMLVSATVAGLLVYALARSALGALLRARAGPVYARVDREMRENAFGYILFMRIVPVFPSFVVNLVAAAFRVDPRVFALATFIGIAPAAFVFSSLGEELGRVEVAADLLSPGVVASLTGLGLLVISPVVYRRWRRRNPRPGRTGKASTSADPALNVRRPHESDA
jgi:uncharacterized membrane protein YdjX (TVP38/TMEM64 family)